MVVDLIDTKDGAIIWDNYIFVIDGDVSVVYDGRRNWVDYGHGYAEQVLEGQVQHNFMPITG